MKPWGCCHIFPVQNPPQSDPTDRDAAETKHDEQFAIAAWYDCQQNAMKANMGRGLYASEQEHQPPTMASVLNWNWVRTVWPRKVVRKLPVRRQVIASLSFAWHFFVSV